MKKKRKRQRRIRKRKHSGLVERYCHKNRCNNEVNVDQLREDCNFEEHIMFQFDMLSFKSYDGDDFDEMDNPDYPKCQLFIQDIYQGKYTDSSI